MTEEHRQRAIRQRLARLEEPRSASPLSTGFPELDAALAVGGLPRGRIIEIFGASSSGKSTTALHIVAHAQAQGATAAWIDAEHSFDARYAASLGVLVEHLPLAQPDYAEQGLEIACRLAVSTAVDLLVIDSAAALVPRLELQSTLGDGGEGLHGRVLASGLRGLSQAAAHGGAVVLVLNQTRSRKQPAGGDDETSAGGAALKLYAAIRIFLEPREDGRVAFRILKNKAAAAFGRGEFHPRRGGAPTEGP